MVLPEGKGTMVEDSISIGSEGISRRRFKANGQLYDK